MLRKTLLATFLVWPLSGQAYALTADKVRDDMVTKGVTSWRVVSPDSSKIIPKPRPTGLILEEELTPMAQPRWRSADRIGRSFGDGTEEARTDLPVRFDWRDKDGFSYLAPMLSEQGDCGACVAFAAASTIEAQYTIACDSWQSPFVLSRQHLFSCGGGDCASGWKLSQAVDFVVNTGLTDQPCFPYQASNGQNASCEEACQDISDRMFEDITYQRPTRGFINIEAIKEALLEGPLLANMILFEDLEYYSSGVYRHVSGRQLGGHAITLVGWDNDDRAWIARNSWGPDWGEDGYFRVAWDDASLVGRYTWLFDVSHSVAAGACTKRR